MRNKIEVKYKLKKEYCSCCGRPFDKNSDMEERVGLIDIVDLVSRVDRSDNEVYAEDLIEFVDIYLFDTFTHSLSSGDLAIIEKGESTKILKIALERLKAINVSIIGEEYI